MLGPSGPSGPRPRECYYKYSALAVGLCLCTLRTVMQDGTTSSTSERLAFASDPHMKYVLDNLPADWTDGQKMQAIEANYGKKYDLLHLWDVFGLIPKLEQFETFINAKYTDRKAFEDRRPQGNFGQLKEENEAREKIYKFSLPLEVRPRAASRAAASCPRRATAPLLPRYCAPRFCLVCAEGARRGADQTRRHDARRLAPLQGVAGGAKGVLRGGR